MPRIKIFIVTYNRPQLLQQNLASLLPQLPAAADLTVINNHTNFSIDPAQAARVSVLHNSLRPDFSTGHLARNWNQAIINGFRDLDNPACDTLITCQDDTIWLDGAFDKIAAYDKYDFITDGLGDNFCIYKPRAVKVVGLWDERFCNIGYQEADYFFRAVIYNPDRSSINDHWHGRSHNPIESPIIRHPQPGVIDANHKASMVHHSYTRTLFQAKWGVDPEQWRRPFPAKSLIQNYIYYPYFEAKVENLAQMNYLV